MEFLYSNEVIPWCEEHGGTIGEEDSLMPDPALGNCATVWWWGKSGLEPEVADACLRALGEFEKVLIWVKEWGIWSNSEDWPRFYKFRGDRGERHDLWNKPGHVFGADERDDLKELLLIVIENGWGGDLVALREGKLAPRIWISHDGYANLLRRFRRGLKSPLNKGEGCGSMSINLKFEH